MERSFKEKVLETQVLAMWPGYEMSAGGFKLSTAPCMHYFHGNGSFQLPISCWLKALQCFVLRLQRRETISLSHNTAPGTAAAAGNKSLVFNIVGSWEEGG